MNKYFFLPIVVGISAGYLFPYQAMFSVGLTTLILFLLMYVNALLIDPIKIFTSIKKLSMQSALSIFLIYIFFPLIQCAIARLLIEDDKLYFGFVMCCLAPSAIVAPYFIFQQKGDVELGLVNLTISTILAPVATALMLPVLRADGFYFDYKSMYLVLSLITIIPLLLGVFTSHRWPRLGQSIKASLSLSNSVLLGSLMFIVVGSSLTKVNPRHWLDMQGFYLLLLILWMDFGVYFLLKFVGRFFAERPQTVSVAISVGARNFAVPAGVLLFYQPSSVLPAALGLVVHVFFFQWLLRPQKTS